MDVIIAGSTGVYQALVVARIMLKPPGQTRLREAIAPPFGDIVLEKQGELIYLGTSRQGIRFYSLGLDPNPVIGMKIIRSFLTIMGGEQAQPLVLRVPEPGAFLIRVARIVFLIPGIGRPVSRRLAEASIRSNWSRLTGAATAMRRVVEADGSGALPAVLDQ
ncbi:MAG: DUF3189 family protein [Solirubrobacterales bacterium]